ncbi:MAG: response regulator transcription factor [Rhodospirillaceae bacterium]|nr:response regulator transcription factor [Rhodospirillaceae bacterium]MBT7356983.1 response regulator transcription factor [Rhodospirillaceae bacterium]
MTAEKILVVEDNAMFARMIKADLAKEGYEVTVTETGAEFLNQADSDSHDCLIVDLTLPDEDGIVLVRKMRARSNVPIIVLTGREGIDDKIACFELGADDYVTKPVDSRELLMRVQAAIRRGDGAEKSRGRLQFGPVELDHARHAATRENGDEIDLTPAEFSLIWVLAQAEGRVLSREDLVDAISSGEGPMSFRAVDILISRVRKKLDKDAIQTVPTVGYKGGWDVQTNQ